MSYYIGREIGFDDMGTDAVEYVVYELQHLSHQHIQSLVKVNGFCTLDEAVEFFRDCYDGKIQAKSSKAPGVAVRSIE
jgi:hypothetical protein